MQCDPKVGNNLESLLQQYINTQDLTLKTFFFFLDLIGYYRKPAEGMQQWLNVTLHSGSAAGFRSHTMEEQEQATVQYMNIHDYEFSL